MKYAIFGASGAVGKELAAVLAENKEHFRVVGRNEESLKEAFAKYSPYVEICVADLSNDADARRAAEDVETVFYIVGVPYNRFDLHPHLSKVSVNAAVSAGVRHFVHLGTLYSYGRMQGERIAEDHPREPHTFKGKMRKEQEDIVMAAHGRNGMQAAILCSPDFYGGDSELSLVYGVFTAALTNKTANVIGPVGKPHEFMFVPDLARTLYQFSKKQDAYGKRWNIGGVGFITVREFAEKVYAQAGSKLRLRAAGTLLLRIMGLWNPVMKEFIEMQYLLDEPLFVDDSALQALVPEMTKTSYEDGIRRTLERMARQ